MIALPLAKTLTINITNCCFLRSVHRVGLNQVIYKCSSPITKKYILIKGDGNENVSIVGVPGGCFITKENASQRLNRDA